MGTREWHHAAREVSILVLVDVFPESLRVESGGEGMKGFNPCFSGWPSRTEPLRLEPSQLLYVSILVLVDVLPEPIVGDLFRFQCPLFQSLF